MDTDSAYMTLTTFEAELQSKKNCFPTEKIEEYHFTTRCDSNENFGIDDTIDKSV